MDCPNSTELQLVTAIMLLILRQEKPVMAVILSIVFSVVLFRSRLTSWLQYRGYDRVDQTGRHKLFFSFHLVEDFGGVAYLGEFTASICNDAGEQAVAKG